jgi:hypothetical protein
MVIKTRSRRSDRIAPREAIAERLIEQERFEDDRLILIKTDDLREFGMAASR